MDVLKDQGLVDVVLSPMIRLIGNMADSTEYSLYDQGHFVCGGREVNLEGKADVVQAVQFLVDLFFARTEANLSELMRLRYDGQLHHMSVDEIQMIHATTYYLRHLRLPW